MSDIQKDPITILITPFKEENILFYYLNENKTVTQTELQFIIEQIELGCAFGSTFGVESSEEYGGYFGYAGTTDDLED